MTFMLYIKQKINENRYIPAIDLRKPSSVQLFSPQAFVNGQSGLSMKRYIDAMQRRESLSI